MNSVFCRDDSALFKKVCLVILFCIIVFLRVYIPEIDPPGNVCYDSSLYIREGVALHNASNLAVFGKWSVAPLALSVKNNPVLSYLQYTNFLLFGTNIASARILYALLSVGGIYLFFLGIMEEYSFETALLGCCFLGCNYIYVVYNRMAIEETPMIALVLTSFFFWQKGRKKRKYRFFTPLFIFSAIYIKSMAIIIIPAFALLCLSLGLWDIEGKGRSWAPLFDFICGSTIFFALFVIADYLLTGSFTTIFSFIREIISTFFSSIPHTQDTVFQFFWKPYFTNTLFISICCFVAFPFVILDFLHRPHRISSGELFFSAWIVVGFMGMNMAQNTPTRYFVNIIPPMAGLLAIKLTNFASKTVPSLAEKDVSIPFLEYFFVMFWFFPLPYFLLDISIGTYTLFFIVSTLVIYPIVSEQRILLFLEKNVIKHAKIISIVLVILFLAFNVTKLSQWLVVLPQRTQVNAIRSFEKTFHGKRIFGRTAFLLTLGNKNIAMFPSSALNSTTDSEMRKYIKMAKVDYFAPMFYIGNESSKDAANNRAFESDEERKAIHEGMHEKRPYKILHVGKYIVSLYQALPDK